MKLLFSSIILAAALGACASYPPRTERAATVVVPPSSRSTTVVIPNSQRNLVVCRDGTRPPCN
jgi:hypothetical protein